MTASTASPSILDQLVKRARRLYTLPAVAMQVVELTDQTTIDAAALKSCIENDPALTTKILRVVNSSLFGLSCEVTDLNQALALLGTKPLKLLVLGFSLPKELLSDVESDVLQRYWQHTLIKAVAARQISELVWDLPGDEAFISGLLQDIGMLVLIQSLGESYVTFLDSVCKGKGDLFALETSTLGFDHAIVSARLLDHWKLPPKIVQAVGSSQDVQRLLDLPRGKQALPQILHLAELVARFLTHQDAALLSRLLDTGQQYHELSETQLESLLESLEAKVPQLAEILCLQLSGDTAYSEVLARAHRQLAEVAADAAAGMCADNDCGERLLQEARDLGQVVERFVGEPLYADPAAPGRVLRTKGHTLQGTPPQAAAPFLDETSLSGLVTAAVASCRQARSAISLALLELDEYRSSVVLNGLAGTQQSVEVLGRTIEAMFADNCICAQVHDARFAIILKGYDRQRAVAAVRDLLAAIRNWSLDKSREGHSAISISAGLATLSMPPKNFPADELTGAAERCLDGVQLSGGDGLKSIEIY